MDTSHLREDIVADDGTVFGYSHARVGLYYLAYVVEVRLIDAGLQLQVVMDQRHYAGERCVTGTFTQAVHRDVHTFHTRLESIVYVGYRQVVVVVCMKVEM